MVLKTQEEAPGTICLEQQRTQSLSEIKTLFCLIYSAECLLGELHLFLEL